MRLTKHFSSGDLAVLEDVDGFSDGAASGAAAEFAPDVPDLGLALARSGGAQLRVGEVGGLLGGGLVPALVDVSACAGIALIGQHD